MRARPRGRGRATHVTRGRGKPPQPALGGARVRTTKHTNALADAHTAKGAQDATVALNKRGKTTTRT
ncbi:unnamed protein product, partial [Iphiclides podalirius]